MSSPELSVRGEKSVMNRTGGAGPGMIRRGRRACRKGRVASTPELSIGGPGWLRLWGVAGSPSVDTLAKGDAPSSPELTVGVYDLDKDRIYDLDKDRKSV